MPTRTLLHVLLLLVALLADSANAQQRRGGKLKSGDAAIDVTLQDALGEETVKLSELRGKPVVLIFGSSTSSRLVESVAAINQIYTDFKDVAHIYVVYLREATRNKDDEAPPQDTLEERRQVARGFAKRVGLLAPILVDTMDNQADSHYAGWPDRIYVIDAAGNVVHKSNYTLDGFGPALSATPFILYKHTEKSFTALPAPVQKSTRSREVQTGDAAPDFTLQDPLGKTTVKLSALQGKPVVLIFGSCT